MLFFKQSIDLLDPSWRFFFEKEAREDYVQKLDDFLCQENRAGSVIYPSFERIFSAFELTPLDRVKVVIMGQDPYHGPRQAHGLSFSVPEEVPPPPSLRNIFKELHRDLGISPSPRGCLISWAKQGVLLLNATLTVREGRPKSHHGKGWELFTDRVIQALCLRQEPTVFILWGKSALEKFQKIKAKTEEHLILTAPHPSPLSAYSGFFGCSHFSKTNKFLKKSGLSEIDWRIFW